MIQKALILLGLLLSSAIARADRLQVVATIPDLQDITQVIGGERVEVRSIALGTQNLHGVTLRPSNLVHLNRADMFVQIGLALEHSYVPGLLMRARNREIEPGGPGFVNCSDGWGAIQIPVTLTRDQGTDLHPMGNPHFNLDPRGGRHIAGKILEGLLRVDPEGKSYYEPRYEAYLERLTEAENRWAEIGKQLADKKLVSYHADFNYLVSYHAMDLVATVEPQPGVPPTPRDLAKLVELMKAEKINLLMTAKWSNNRSLRFVAEKTGARIFEAPAMVGGVPGADSWIEMMDILHNGLLEAFQ